MTGDYTLDLIQPEVSKLHAYHQPSTFESVILYETNISEKEQLMTDEKIPFSCLANVSLIVEEAIEVTEITDNKPEDIFISTIPKEENGIFSSVINCSFSDMLGVFGCCWTLI